jgi:hypothetical protein
MKITLILAMLSCLSLYTWAQEAGWDVCMDGKKLLSTTSGRKTDTLHLSGQTMAGRKYLEVSYREAPSNIPWTYRLKLLSPEGETLLEKNFGKPEQPYRLPITEILRLSDRHAAVLLYLEQHPADPEMSIRSKQVLLAFLQLKPPAHVP